MGKQEEKHILSKNTIFIDFFDTLVHRTVAPEEIKRLWAKKVSFILNSSASTETVYYTRKAAENDLEKKYGYTYDNRQLIDTVFFRLFDAGLCNMTNDTFYDKVSDIEPLIEKRLLYVDEATKRLLYFSKENNKQVYIISDYHLGKMVINDYLMELGIFEYVSGCYVSADYKASKFEGDLYGIVLRDLGLDASVCVMVGDNKFSDVDQSHKNGIMGIYKPYAGNAQQTRKRDFETFLLKLMKEDGYSGFSFSLSLFIERLYKELKEKDAKKVFFLAREGQFLKQLFDMYLSVINDTTIDSKYLYVSRQSTFVASLSQDLERETFENLFRQFNNLSIRQFLMNIGFSQDDIDKVEKSISVDMDFVSANFAESEEFREMKKHPVFSLIYKDTVSMQKMLFEAYLKQEGYDWNSPFYIVDVGWKGTIQDNIFRFLGKDKPVCGLYVGYGELAPGTRYPISQKRGLLFSIVPYESRETVYWAIDAGLFEKILYASHSSTSAYAKVHDVVVPVMKEYKEEKGIYDIVRPIQLAIYKDCRKIFEKFFDSMFMIEDFKHLILELHLKTLLTMNFQKIDFRRMVEEKHFENFGTFDTVLVGIKSNKFNPKKDMKYFLKRIKKLVDPEYFIRNCYHFSRVKSQVFWKVYSFLIYHRAKRYLQKSGVKK